MKNPVKFFTILLLTALTLFLSCELAYSPLSYQGSQGQINPGQNNYEFFVTETGNLYIIEKVVFEALNFTSAKDLKITLITPAGTRLVLIDQEGETNRFVGAYTFVGLYNSDGIDHLVTYLNDVVPNETYCANSSFGDLEEQDIYGKWELEIFNYSTTISGTLGAWHVDFRYDVPDESPAGSNIP